MVNNFNDGITPGKMQFGSGWWFMDQKYGMIDQLNTLSSLGLLEPICGDAHRLQKLSLLSPA